MNSIHYHKVRSGMNAFITKAQTQPVHLSSQPALTSGDCQWWVAGATVGKNYFSNYKIRLAPSQLSAPLCADGIAPGRLRPGPGLVFIEVDLIKILFLVVGALTVIHFPTPPAQQLNTSLTPGIHLSASEFSRSPAKHLTKLGHIDTEVRGIQKYFH